jgi:hypothetical protein
MTRPRHIARFDMPPAIREPIDSGEERPAARGRANAARWLERIPIDWNIAGVGHPGLVTRKDGMVRMDRPKYLTDEAQAEDFKVAVDEIRSIAAQRRGHSSIPEE